MSVLIRGMEMPSECEYCPLCRYYPGDKSVWCNALNVLLKRQWDDANIAHLDVSRREDCPLIEVPTPHGRLADIDRLQTVFERNAGYNYPDIFDNAPIVVEAED